jgi:MarR family transcriptional regulator, lower aerobic nicotinate degradation pathway regulator
VPVHEPSSQAPTRIRDRPTWLISRAYGRSRAALSEGFAASELGVRGYEYRLLAALADSGPASQSDLGRSAALDRSDVATVVAELERKRFVAREVDPANRRRNIVSLTPEGAAALEALDRVLDGIQARVMAPLSDRERAQLVRLLRKLSAGD